MIKLTGPTSPTHPSEVRRVALQQTLKLHRGVLIIDKVTVCLSAGRSLDECHEFPGFRMPGYAVEGREKDTEGT